MTETSVTGLARDFRKGVKMTTNQSHLIPLSAYDQSLVGTLSLVGLLYYSRMPDPERLRFSFTEALERFPRFASRIVRTTRGHFALAPLEDWPALRLGASAAWTPDQFSAEQASSFVNNLQSIPGEPVIAASLTPVDSGAVIGISLSHVVADAYSLSLFMSCWAGRSAMMETPGIRRRFVPTSTPRRAVAYLSDIADNQELDPIASQRLQRIREMRRCFSTLAFDRAHLGSIRAELSTREFTPSPNEALTAFLLHRYATKIIGRSGDFRVRMPVDVRGFHPALPADFIGNGFLEAVLSLDEAIDSPSAMADTARRIHRAVTEIRRKSRRGHQVEFDGTGAPAFDPRTDVVSTNLAKLRLDELDFGDGPPLRHFCILAASAGFTITSAAEGVEVQFITKLGPVS